MPQADLFAPNYELKINGEALAPDFYSMIKSVEFEDESDKVSSMKINLEYSKPVIGGISADVINMKLFAPGNIVTLRGGYGDQIDYIGSAYIVDLDPDFPETGPPKLAITCYDHLHKLSIPKSEKGEIHKGISDHQIVQNYGIKWNMIVSQTDSALNRGIRKTTSKKIRTQKRGTTDLAFLQEIAKLNSFDVYSKYDFKQKRFELFFEPPTDQSKPLFTFEHGEGDTPFDVEQSFTVPKPMTKPKLSLATQFTKYKVVAFDKVSNKKIDVTLSMDDFMKKQKDIKFGGANADTLLKKDAAISGAAMTQKAFGETVEIISKKVFNNAEDAKKYLILHMKKIARDFINGNGRVNGNALLKSRQVHTFAGLGAFFNGRYYFKKVRHIFDENGYNTHIEARRVLLEESA